MSTYISHAGTQSGPFEDEWIIEQLEAGRLSPDDLGIRTGGKEWQPLKMLFPNVAPVQSDLRPAVPIPSTGEPPVNIAGSEIKKGGCRKLLGWALLVLGLLLFLGGIAGAGVNRVIPPGVCQTADDYYADAEKAVKEAEAAKGTPQQAQAEAKAKEKLETASAWSKGCSQAASTHLIIFAALLAAGFVGLIMAVIGFFVRRGPAA